MVLRATTVLVFAICVPAAAAATCQKPGSRAPLDLVLLVDRSGSMAGKRMETVKKTLRQLVPRLRKGDRFGLIGFDTTPRVIYPLGDPRNRRALGAALKELTPGGGTAFREALHHAELILRSTRGASERGCHVVLLSDGQAAYQGVEAAVGRLQQLGATLSTLGLGGDADEQLLGSMARWGKGRFHKAVKLRTLRQLLARELRRVGR